MPRYTGASLIVRLLERQGVRLAAGIPGGANLPLYDALDQSKTIRHILPRHEQGAGFIAQGVARITGEPGVCIATSGPGATNLLTAIADARMDSVPLVCLTGQVPSGMLGTDAFQEVDIYSMSIPVTKHNFQARSAAELAEIIPEAFRIAASGKPGPVLVDLPKDVQMGTVELDELPEPGRAYTPPLPPRAEIERAAAMINAAERPALLVGGGAARSKGAARWVRTLCEKISAPAAMTLMGLGTVDADHPLALGMLGMHAAPCTNILLEESDCIIALGMRFDDRATGLAEKFCPNAEIVHVDIDPGEIHKICRAGVGLVGDAGAVLEALVPMIHEQPRLTWLERVVALKRSHEARHTGADDPRSPYGLVRCVAELMGDNAIIATDVGQHQMRTAQTYPFKRPGRLVTSGGLGTMGFGLPAAIGASLADPETRVACFSGDGSLLMNIQEMATAVEQQANVTILLANNHGLGLVRQQQQLFYGNRLAASSFGANPDFAALARAFGMRGIDLADCADPTAALAASLSGEGPCLVNVPVEDHPGVYPMVPPGAANIHMIGEDHVTATA